MTTSDVLLSRLASGSRPGSRDDNARVALVVEGGGMRGVIPAGMLLALEQLGLRNSFDMVVGTSAGAIAAAFFVTGLGTQVAPIYYRDLNQAPFLNTRRLLRFQPALDLDYLVDEALVERGFSAHEVAHNPIPLFATVVPVEADNPNQMFRVAGDDDRVRSILKATASLPVLGGPAKEVDGEFYVDGGLRHQIPWRQAIDLGATHILALPSRPIAPNEPRSSVNFVERYTVLPLIKTMHGDHVAHRMRQMADQNTAEATNLFCMTHKLSTGLTSAGERWDGHISYVEVHEDIPLPERLETEQSVLVEGMRNGAQAVVDHFALGNIEVEHRIELTHPAARIGHYRTSALSQIVAARHRAMEAESAAPLA